MSEYSKQYLLSLDNLFWKPFEVTRWLRSDLENGIAVLTDLLQERWNNVFEVVVRLYMEIQVSISTLQFISIASNKNEFTQIQLLEENNLKLSIQKYRTLSPIFLDSLQIY